MVKCDACGRELNFDNDRIYFTSITSDQIRPCAVYTLCEDCHTDFVKHAFDEKGKDDENPNS